MKSNRTKHKLDLYESLFMKPAGIATRSGKGVYIRPEYHKRIMQITHTIGEGQITLFDYIDNVLEHHFNTFQDDISELYRKRRPEDIF